MPSPTPPLTIIKTCGCGRTYTAAEWNALPFAGIYADDVERLELRHCPCGSTLAFPPAPEPPATAKVSWSHEARGRVTRKTKEVPVARLDKLLAKIEEQGGHSVAVLYSTAGGAS